MGAIAGRNQAEYCLLYQASAASQEVRIKFM